MSSSSATSQKVMATAVAAAGIGVACYLAANASRRRTRGAARKQAACPYEYHVAVHGSGAGESRCALAKVPKSSDLPALRAAVAASLGLQASEADSLQLRPVLRGNGSPSVGQPLTDAGGLAGFDSLLLQRSADELQVVELVCTLRGEEPPATAPPPPQPFPEPGRPLPFLGHLYLLMGPEAIPTYNITNKAFPPSAPKYPYGASVRSYSGGSRSKVADFPEGTVFHPEVEVYTTWSADARVVEELLARSAEFPKLWNRPQQIALQDFTGNGLFTSSETSEDWQAAHSVLPRGFNQIKIKSFAPQILAKTRAFIREWSAFPAGHKVEEVNHWLTAMTADAVVTCSMGMDMRNVERMGEGKEPHPFVANFRFGLGYSGGNISAKSEFGLKRFLPGFGAKARLQARYAESKRILHELVDQMVEQTRVGELGGQDSIIRAMLQDKASNGKHVHYNALYGQVINLMIAGHETTAATLGFTMQLLAENPQYEARALEEVRRVLDGRTEPSADDVPKLQFVEQCFREALRLYSPVTILSRDAAYDTLLQGHRVFQGERIGVVTRALHTNPEYWGGEFGDPLTYNPDRFSPEAVKKRHPNAYHPWGFGNRACIGSQFAIFEAKTFLASMLLHFKLVAVPGFKLKASLDAGGAAPSPGGLEFLVYPRPGGPLYAADGSMLLLQPLSGGSADTPKPAKQVQRQPSSTQEQAAVGGAPMQVLYGSNSGSSQEFAGQVATAARKSGFSVAVMSLDRAVKEKLVVPGGPFTVVVTSTYNGNPPDNAAAFKAWLTEQKEGSLAGMHFAVFGVGNSQWQTYQQFPREVDALLEHCGAQRAFVLGACDVDGPSFDTDFEEWLTGLLRSVGGAVADGEEGEEDPAEAEAALEFLVEEPGAVAPGPLFTGVREALEAIRKAKVDAAKALDIAYDNSREITPLEVAAESRELCQRADNRSVRHVTLRLPEKSAGYRAGDHLEVLPVNDSSLVAMVLGVLGLQEATPLRWDMKKAAGSNRSARDNVAPLREKMPLIHVTAKLVLEWIPDLAAVPNRKFLGRLARKAKDDALRERLQALSSNQDKYKQEVATPQLCVAELLQSCAGKISLTIGELCALAKPLAPRYYSVSSSPAGAEDPRLVTVSVGQLQFKTGTGRTHRGLASTMLGGLAVGSCVPGTVRQLTGNFHVPQDPLAPMIMVGPGTGIAPMMGFLQERESRMKKGEKLGPAILFFGCRKREEDYLYREELAGYLKSGALTELHVAFSREGPQKVYVQDLIFEQRASVWRLLQKPSAAVFVCGDARAMAPDVRRAFQRVAQECGGKSEAKAASMLGAMVEGGRYLEDVWAS